AEDGIRDPLVTGVQTCALPISLAAFLCDHLGMHEIDRTGRFTLVGADARRGKITLFDAEGPRRQGALARVVLRVNDLAAAVDLRSEERRVGKESRSGGRRGRGR